MSFLSRSVRLLRGAPKIRGAQLVTVRTFVKPTGGDAEYDKAYKLFDADGDGELTPEELSHILTSIGETPGDLNLFFSGMTTETTTDFKPCVDWLTFLIKHVNTFKEPSKAEELLVASLAKFGTNDHNITSDGLFEWIDSNYPDMTDEEIEHLVDGADIDGDCKINFVAYANIVCDKILQLNSAALQSAFETLDKDGSGDLSAEEMATHTTRASLEERLNTLDLDNSGTISFVEFLFGIRQSRGDQYLAEAFGAYDTNQSGYISAAELLQFYHEHEGELLTSEDVEKLIAGADFNGDGKIDYNEFIAMVAAKSI